ncbi:Rrf2 family transcriptional regulator [Hyphomicrobium sp.]|jgi:Rrf2 family nitric oxide-sensitive transcriptional repressor|uniref:RrF2 family transcriptional regulator n=1 Tax=Hyphomicrobium sp. TaxID=82 RepID=UPI003562D92B
MRLTKQTGHAIRILIDCAIAKDQLVKVADVSDRLGVTKQNVFKIVHILSHAGFLTAVRGPNGGVRLAKPASVIRIGDVVRAIEVTRVQVEGGIDPQSSDADPGNINAMFDNALTAFISVLDQHTLAELAVKSPIGFLETVPNGESVPGSKVRGKKPAARGARRT